MENERMDKVNDTIAALNEAATHLQDANLTIGYDEGNGDEACFTMVRTVGDEMRVEVNAYGDTARTLDAMSRVAQRYANGDLITREEAERLMAEVSELQSATKNDATRIIRNHVPWKEGDKHPRRVVYAYIKKVEAAREEAEHDPWNKADGHNYLFCEHQVCRWVRGYEDTLGAAIAERDEAVKMDEQLQAALKALYNIAEESDHRYGELGIPPMLGADAIKAVLAYIGYAKAQGDERIAAAREAVKEAHHERAHYRSGSQ